jgi:hypothetical protein
LGKNAVGSCDEEKKISSAKKTSDVFAAPSENSTEFKFSFLIKRRLWTSFLAAEFSFLSNVYIDIRRFNPRINLEIAPFLPNYPAFTHQPFGLLIFFLFACMAQTQSPLSPITLSNVQ